MKKGNLIYTDVISGNNFQFCNPYVIVNGKLIDYKQSEFSSKMINNQNHFPFVKINKHFKNAKLYHCNYGDGSGIEFVILDEKKKESKKRWRGSFLISDIVSAIVDLSKIDNEISTSNRNNTIIMTDNGGTYIGNEKNLSKKEKQILLDLHSLCEKKKSLECEYETFYKKLKSLK